jgi:hypothetical protein
MGPYLLAESRGEADDVEVATEWILEGFVPTKRNSALRTEGKVCHAMSWLRSGQWVRPVSPLRGRIRCRSCGGHP